MSNKIKSTFSKATPKTLKEIQNLFKDLGISKNQLQANLCGNRKRTADDILPEHK